MKTASKLLFSLLAYFLLLTSCQVSKAQSGHSLFWEISGKDLQKPSYLFGTHHLLNSDFLARNAIVTQKLQQTELVAGEIIIDSTKLLETAIAGIMLDNSLDNILSKEDFEATDKVLKEQTGYSLPMLNMFKPMTVYILITNAKHLKSLNKDAPGQHLSIDEYFQKKGQQMGKPVIGLETMEEQINVLYTVYPLERQVELLKAAVYDKENTVSEEISQINKLYKHQQIEKLFEVAKRTMLPNEYQALLVDRNNKWLAQLKQEMPRRPMFIAVGAMHLAGPDGLIHQLKKQGYKLRPIRISLEK
jgi:uncharacterized protein